MKSDAELPKCKPAAGLPLTLGQIYTSVQIHMNKLTDLYR